MLEGLLMILSLPVIVMMAAAVIPGIYLLRYIYKMDHVEKEPGGLLAKLFILGIISTICALFTETVGLSLLNGLLPQGGLLYMLLENFIVIALSEEGFKYMVLKRATWKHPAFNYQFDGIVYAVFVSLGFAVWENIQYVFSYGLGTALVRAVTAVPGHACFGVLMGAFYGLAKKCEAQGREEKKKRCLRNAVLLPVIGHGAYDFCASNSSVMFTIAFVVIVLGLYYLCYNLVKAISEIDGPIEGDPDFRVL